MALDPSMPVLVVDDYSTMVRIIRNLLRQLGFADIDDAPDGAAALDKMHAKRYGLVISDWNMEPMTGYDLLRQVRADPELETTPFIMVTAESKTENVIAARKAGVNNYIVKPFNAQTLKSQDRGGVRRERIDSSRSPFQLTRDRFRRDAGGGEHRVESGQIRRLAPAEFLGMDAGDDEQAIDAERRRALEVGSDRIADRQHPAERRHLAAAKAAALPSAAS